MGVEFFFLVSGYYLAQNAQRRNTNVANATILGETTIGNNVIVSSNTYIINEKVPDNCIVFGQSPNIVIKEKSEPEILEMTKHIWRW